jgi:DNA-directed RNA polymerase subunit RPC12/RpoP
MECPHCHQTIPGIECPYCGVTIPQESHFCMNCGADLVEEREEETGEDNGFELEDRVLCPDGTCTGIIVDGKCTECGKSEKEAG